MAAVAIVFLCYFVIAALALRRFLVHLAWQPYDDEDRLVAKEPDWVFALKWAPVGAVCWLPIFLWWASTKIPWMAFPRSFKGRFELAAERQAEEDAHKERCADLDMPVS